MIPILAVLLFTVVSGCSSSFKFEAFENVQTCKDCYNCLAGINPTPIIYDCDNRYMVLTTDSDFMFRCNCYPRSVIVTNLEKLATSVLITKSDELNYYIGVINGTMTSITFYSNRLSLTLNTDSAAQYIPYLINDGVIGVTVEC